MELYVGAGLVLPKPAASNQGCTVFSWTAAVTVQERPVDLLDADPAVLDRLNGVGCLQELARRCFRIGEGGVKWRTSCRSPAVGVGLGVVAAAVVAAIDQDIADTGGAISSIYLSIYLSSIYQSAVGNRRIVNSI